MIALMEDEFIKRRTGFPAEEFLHGVALSQILGSFPVNTALCIGHRLHGFVGSILGSMAFLAPSLLASNRFRLYREYCRVYHLWSSAAAWSMGQNPIKGYITWGLINPVLILGVGGLVGWLLKLAKPPAVKQEHPQGIVALPVAMQTVATAPAVIAR